MTRVLVSTALAAALFTGFATPARAELASWDQAKVTSLAKQLDAAAQALYDTFFNQPKPIVGQERAFYRLKQDIRHIKNDAKQLARELAKGAGREETQPSYEDLMQSVRRAQDNAARVFTAKDLNEKAGAARAVLNQISPYYDAAATPLEPVER
jgi:hypothetical protein